MTLPLTCDLSPDAIKARRAGLLPGLAEQAVLRAQTEGGYELTFAASSEMLHAIVAVIDAERQCCRWLRFDLAVLPDGRGILLKLSGPEGAGEFLSALMQR